MLYPLPTKEVAEETMRGGKSQLTPVNKKNKTKGGLNKDYAFPGVMEFQKHLPYLFPVCRVADLRKRNYRRFKVCR